MLSWLRDLDQLLRGELTRPDVLRRQGRLDVSSGGLSLVAILLGAIYGVCMGCYALFRDGGPFGMQVLASAVKLPALFFLTLLVTFPSLYVFNSLVGSRLGPGALLRLVVAALAVMLTVLSSLGPIVAFFSIMTTSYGFVQLLNVAVCAVSGVLGLSFLLRTLQRLSVAVASQAQPIEVEPIEVEPIGPKPEPEPQPPSGTRPPGALDREQGRLFGPEVKLVFRCWVVLFGLVGAQMAWVLRPFIGTPDQPFSWFRPRQSNFFEAILHALTSLFG